MTERDDNILMSPPDNLDQEQAEFGALGKPALIQGGQEFLDTTGDPNKQNQNSS